MSDQSESDFEETIQQEEPKVINKPKGGFDYRSMRNGDLHMLPFTLDYNGKADVDVYFHYSQKERDVDSYSANFRGMAINGKKISIDKGNTNSFYVDYENVTPSFCKSNRSVKINDLYVWNFAEDVSRNQNIRNINMLLDTLDLLQ